MAMSLALSRSQIERYQRRVCGVEVLAHRHSHDDLDASWHTCFAFRLPENRVRGWLRDVVDNLTQAAGRGGPGQFFANHPTVFRRMGMVIVMQRCGFDI